MKLTCGHSKKLLDDWAESETRSTNAKKEHTAATQEHTAKILQATAHVTKLRTKSYKHEKAKFLPREENTDDLPLHPSNIRTPPTVTPEPSAISTPKIPNAKPNATPTNPLSNKKKI